jgi:hypothetical protein
MWEADKEVLGASNIIRNDKFKVLDDKDISFFESIFLRVLGVVTDCYWGLGRQFT